MSTACNLMSPTSVRSGVPFIVTIDVRGGQPGRAVTVKLAQTRGLAPSWPPREVTAPAGEDGVASASFSVALEGPALSVMLAMAYDGHGTTFHPDAAAIHVL